MISNFGFHAKDQFEANAYDLCILQEIIREEKEEALRANYCPRRPLDYDADEEYEYNYEDDEDCPFEYR